CRPRWRCIFKIGPSGRSWSWRSECECRPPSSSGGCASGSTTACSLLCPTTSIASPPRPLQAQVLALFSSHHRSLPMCSFHTRTAPAALAENEEEEEPQAKTTSASEELWGKVRAIVPGILLNFPDGLSAEQIHQNLRLFFVADDFPFHKSVAELNA